MDKFQKQSPNHQAFENIYRKNCMKYGKKHYFCSEKKQIPMKNYGNKKSHLTDIPFFNGKSSHKSPIKKRRLAGN
jgi:hypothetical protein